VSSIPTVARAAARPLVSEKDFLGLPESTDKIELVDGEVVVSPSPTYWHQEILMRLVGALRAWAAKQKRQITVGQAPLDVRFAPGRILQPDAFVLFARVPRGHTGPIDKLPALCVEVLSDDRLHDRVTKRLLYAAAGVTEYWIVEPAGVVERWSGGGLARAEELRDRLTSPVLPGFSLDLRRLFSAAGTR
jgi:Uma2 family endonuclease